MSLDDDDLKNGDGKGRFVMVQSVANDVDAKKYKIYEEWGKFSRYIAGVFDDTAVGPDYVLDFKTTRPRTIPFLVDFLRHRVNSAEHKPLQKPVVSNQLRDAVPCQWCASFIESVSDQDDFFELMLVANYLSCDTLADLCMTKLGTQIVGKSDKELRQFFGCEGDATPEENAEACQIYADLLEIVASTSLRPRGTAAKGGKDAGVTEGKTE